MVAVPVGGEAVREIEPGLSRSDHVQQQRAGKAAEHLRNHVRQDLAGGMPSAGPEPEGHRRIQVTSGNVSDRKRHREHGEPERERDTHEPDTDVEAAVLGIVREFRGSISAEHGIGQLKRAQLKSHKSPVALSVMRSIKQALDPNGIMNPGKVV